MEKRTISREAYTYSLSESVISHKDFGTVAVYGISISGNGVTAVVNDISYDFNYVCFLFELIVEGELYPEHLADVVEDYLTMYSPENVHFRNSEQLPLVI